MLAGRVYTNKNTAERRNRLIDEILRGEKKKDTLPNSSFSFDKETQAAYFAQTRRNMKSDMAYATMHHGSQTDDLKVSEVMNSGKLQRNRA